jgi:hypothetical protein
VSGGASVEVVSLVEAHYPDDPPMPVVVVVMVRVMKAFDMPAQ